MARSETGRGARRGRGYYARYLAHYTKKNNTLLVLGGVFLLSVVLGTLLLRSADGETLDLLERLVDGFLGSRNGASLYHNFTASLGSSMIFVGALFVCGFCAISQPLVALAPLLRGLGFGFSAASLYARYGAGAAGYVGVLMVPGMLLSTAAILICCQQALRLAGSFFATMRPSAKAAEPHSLRLYLANFLAAGILCVVAAFVEAVLYSAFGGMFALV